MPEGPPARLMLAAWGLYPLALAHASWILLMRLVFGVCDMFNFRIPTGSAGSALIALALSWAAVEALVDDRGPMSPGLTRCGVIFRVA